MAALRGIVLVLFSCLILAGCGGGGSDSPSLDDPNKTPDQVNNDPGSSDTTTETGNDTIEDGVNEENPGGEVVGGKITDEKFTHLVGGINNACAFGADEVRCWGDNTEQQLSINGEKPVSEVEIGLKHICIISDGFVKCSGNNTFGQANPPTDILNPRSLSLGNQHSCVIDKGAVRCWGRDIYRLISDVPPVVNPIAVVSGSAHSCVLHKGGVTCWGKEDEGQTKVPPTVTKPSAIFAEANHTCALQDGKIICWGDSQTGQMDIPDQLSGTKQLALGDTHDCALDSNGVTCWGNNNFNKTDVPESISDVSSISVSTNFSCALTKGDIVCWGTLNRLMTVAEGTNLSFPKLTQVVDLFGTLHLESGATLSLPLVTVIKDQKISIAGSGQLLTGQLANLSDTGWELSDGAQFGGDSIAPETQLTLSKCCREDGITVSGEGSRLDFSNVSVLTVGYIGYLPVIKASDEGVLDLSGVTKLVNEGGAKGKLTIKTEFGGSLDISRLETVESKGGETRFEFENTTTLPNATRLEAAVISLSGGVSFLLPNLEELVRSRVILDGENTQFITGVLKDIDNTRWVITGGAQFGGDAIAPSTVVKLSNCCNNDGILVEGEGSFLDMSNVSVLVAGYNLHKTVIEVSQNALLDLSGLNSIVNNGSQGSNWVFESQLGGGINLENAMRLQSTNGALTSFIAMDDGSTIDISNLCSENSYELISDQGGEILNSCME